MRVMPYCQPESAPQLSLSDAHCVLPSVNKTTTLKTKTEAPKHKRSVNIIDVESQIKVVMYHE